MKYLPILLIIFLACSDSSNKRRQVANESSKQEIKTEVKYKIISDSTNQLEAKIQTLKLQYTLWGCACPEWITISDALKYSGTNAFFKHHIYIERATPSLYYPDSNFEFNKQKVIVTGQFYEREDYPKGTIETEEKLPKAKVFRYTKIKVTNH